MMNHLRFKTRKKNCPLQKGWIWFGKNTLEHILLNNQQTDKRVNITNLVKIKYNFFTSLKMKNKNNRSKKEERLNKTCYNK